MAPPRKNKDTPAESPTPADTSAERIVPVPDFGEPAPALAREALAAAPLPPGDATEETPATSTPEESPSVVRRGRPKGSRNKLRTTRPGGHKPTKEELAAEVARLEEQLDARDPEAREVLQEAIDSARLHVRATAKGIFSIVAVKTGDAKWRLADDEADELASHLAPAIAPYLGKFAALLPFTSSAFVLWSIVDKRLSLPAQSKPELVAD